MHFPGFEPLDAQAHRRRYERAASASAAVWGCSISVGEFQLSTPAPFFAVDATGPGWATQTRVHVLDHNQLVGRLNNRPLAKRMIDGYRSAARVIGDGGMAGYFRHAWRFGLFFVFPFLLMAAGMLLAAGLALAPWMAGWPAWHCLWSAPPAIALFVMAFVPFSHRLHTLHLFSDWQLAVSMARLDDAATNDWIAAAVETARHAMTEDADEYLITSHSMGSAVAVQVIGSLLAGNADIFAGKRVVFVTLGSAVLQCALLRPATALRARVGLVARCPAIRWLDVQCLTDAIHFYKSKVVAIAGHADAPQAGIVYIRFKHMLTAAHYRKIKRDMLRVHRQYVLGSDKRTDFDFSMMTAGPLPAAAFGVTAAQRPQDLAADGAIVAADISGT